MGVKRTIWRLRYLVEHEATFVFDEPTDFDTAKEEIESGRYFEFSQPHDIDVGSGIHEVIYGKYVLEQIKESGNGKD